MTAPDPTLTKAQKLAEKLGDFVFDETDEVEVIFAAFCLAFSGLITADAKVNDMRLPDALAALDRAMVNTRNHMTLNWHINTRH
jgi:hypothetical protein